jgi:catechol 2,3-dioxygenase-like lactoylglutathione lyase family enzyme
LTVPDLGQAVDFFTTVVGARLLYHRSLEPGTQPETMRENFHAHPQAGYRLAKLGLGDVGLELFEYDAPDQHVVQPRNCDVGGSHLAFRVVDLDAAVARAESHPGVRILGDRQTLPRNHPMAGRTWVYLLTPWDQQLELVSDAAIPDPAPAPTSTDTPTAPSTP